MTFVSSATAFFVTGAAAALDFNVLTLAASTFPSTRAFVTGAVVLSFVRATVTALVFEVTPVFAGRVAFVVAVTFTLPTLAEACGFFTLEAVALARFEVALALAAVDLATTGFFTARAALRGAVFAFAGRRVAAEAALEEVAAFVFEAVFLGAALAAVTRLRAGAAFLSFGAGRAAVFPFLRA